MSQEDDKNNNINTVTKIYPFFGKNNNRLGYYIGDYKIKVDVDKLPFNSLDQVDHMIYNLYNYAKTRKNPKDFFIYHPEKMTFIPTKLETTQPNIGGGRSNKRKTIKKNSRKNSRNRKNNKSYKKLQ
jgi:hypothetical protein